MPSATITFYRSPTTVVLPAPTPGYQLPHKRYQVRAFSAAGEPYVYDKGVATNDVKISIDADATQKDALVSFYNTTTVGAVNTFTYTDHLGDVHTDVRLWADLEIAKNNHGRYDITITLLMADEAD